MLDQVRLTPAQYGHNLDVQNGTTEALAVEVLRHPHTNHHLATGLILKSAFLESSAAGSSSSCKKLLHMSSERIYAFVQQPSLSCSSRYQKRLVFAIGTA